MRKIVVGTTTAALALTCGAIAPTAQAAPVQPAAPATPTVLKTIKVDVNGDGKTDTVTVTALGGTQYELKVVTAKVTSAVTYTSVADATEAWQVWKGAAKLDGVKGSELIVALDSPVNEGSFAVYTWRKGALVAEAAPAAPGAAGWWATYQHGFRFFASGGRAHVDVTNLSAAVTHNRNTAKIVRSVWRNGKWVKTSTRTVKLTSSRAENYVNLHAPSILVSQVKVDMDGDGKLDSVTYRQLAPNTHQTKIVTAKGKVIKRSIAEGRDYSGAGMIATIDGVTGAELAYSDSDGYSWKVLTLRKGKLVVAPSPEGGKLWTRSPENGAMNYDLASVAGQWQVTTRTFDDYMIPTTMHWTRYLWVSGKWSKDTAWTSNVTEDEARAMCHGFCGVDVIQL
ncbi:MAG: hypothetical protein LWW77_10435 [Propionibacteriales bacterium]|nr:hypothetical protein [Propionibacteriales bacterium]